MAHNIISPKLIIELDIPKTLSKNACLLYGMCHDLSECGFQSPVELFYKLFIKLLGLVRPQAFILGLVVCGITHNNFKNSCFSKGLGWSSPNFRDLKVPRPRQDRDFSYPRPRPGLRDPRPSKNGLKTETETET